LSIHPPRRKPLSFGFRCWHHPTLLDEQLDISRATTRPEDAIAAVAFMSRKATPDLRTLGRYL